MRKYSVIFLLLISQLTFAQYNKQNIRGVVIDKLSQTPLIGATVKIINNSENKGAISDKNGNYKISDLAPDRYELKISYIGYKNVFISNVVVSSGKETILDISMEEEFKLTNEVIVTANEKGKTINDLATVSAREFSMEEVNRYAGGRYYTSFDLEASQATGHEVLKSDNYTYTSTYDNYFRLDLKIGYTINSNSSKISHSLALDLQNITNNKNVFSLNYDERDRAIKTTYQLGFFPNFTYKFQF